MSKKKRVNPNESDPLYMNNRSYTGVEKVIRINPTLDDIMKTNKVVKLNRHVRVADDEIEELMGVLVPFRGKYD